MAVRFGCWRIRLILLILGGPDRQFRPKRKVPRHCTRYLGISCRFAYLSGSGTEWAPGVFTLSCPVMAIEIHHTHPPPSSAVQHSFHGVPLSTLSSTLCLAGLAGHAMGRTSYGNGLGNTSTEVKTPAACMYICRWTYSTFLCECG